MARGSGPPLGSKNALKLKTPDLKLEAYRQYCDHIGTGYPKESWWFDHPELTLTWETMEKYIREEPTIFEPIHKKRAESKSYKHWFSVLAASATGENEKANTASLQMIMRNKFKWDKQDKVDNVAETDVRAFLKHIQEKK